MTRGLLVLIALAALVACTSREQAWVDGLRTKCSAMGGNLVYDSSKKEAACYRAPLARFPRRLFHETYAAPGAGTAQK